MDREGGKEIVTSPLRPTGYLGDEKKEKKDGGKDRSQ